MPWRGNNEGQRVQTRSYSQKGVPLYYRAIDEFEPSQRQRVYIDSRSLLCYVVQWSQ